MSIGSLLANDTMTVRRPTNSRDAAGGRSIDWPAVYTNVPCRVESPTADQRVQFDQLQMAVAHRVFTQQGGLKNGDRIDTSDGWVLRVTGIDFRKQLGTIPAFYVVTAEESKA